MTAGVQHFFCIKIIITVLTKFGIHYIYKKPSIFFTFKKWKGGGQYMPNFVSNNYFLKNPIHSNLRNSSIQQIFRL